MSTRAFGIDNEEIATVHVIVARWRDTMTTLDETTVADFRSRLRGGLITPADDGYEGARWVWNANIDRRPALIARCAGVSDVIASVEFARRQDLRVAVRGGGHNVAGHGTVEGGLVIDLSPMKSVHVDPWQRVARAEPGVVWGEFDRETQVHGLATPGGQISNTGVAGLTLGGGFGSISGMYGMTSDNLLSADVVTADGRFLRASDDENADLFWALRGGGGNFGIVTSFEFRLYPVGPMVWGGMLIHPLSAARDVLHFVRDFAADAPDEVFVIGGVLSTPDGTPVSAIVLAHSGSLEEGERALAPARQFGSPIADLVQPMPYVQRQKLMDDGMAAHGIQRYWKSGFTPRPSDEIIDLMVEGGSTFTSPMSAIITYPLGGQIIRPAPDHTAYALRTLLWDVNVIGQWVDPSESARHINWVRGLWGRIEPRLDGTVYINHATEDEAPATIRASYGSNHARLVELKRKYDPDNFFRVNANIPPA
jgi:FAD/FMN-containing dehydrogenase